MKRLFFWLLTLALLAAPALAQDRTIPGRYLVTPPTLVDGQWSPMLLDSNAHPITANSGGIVASGATDSGNPLKIGGVYNSTIPTLTTGQRGDGQLTPGGAFLTGTGGLRNTGADGLGNTNIIFPISTNAADVQATVRTGLAVAPWLFNGSSWDRQFTCTSQAAINVTAASTTQIVALSGSTIIRVCSFAISMSAAGTAKFVYGTGSNCGTGTTDINTAMTLATGTPLAMSAGNNSLFRGAAGAALCVAAVTGNVTGFVSYAQF